MPVREPRCQKQDSKGAIINMLKELKQSVMRTFQQIQYFTKETEIITKKENQLEILEFKSMLK